MRTLLKLAIFLTLAGAAVAAAIQPIKSYLHEKNRPRWRTAAVTQGTITAVVNSTGNVQPVLSVSIGSFVSGPIVELNVDFNDEVSAGDVLARVDPRLFAANVERDEAILATREAEVSRVEALLKQSENKEERGKRLRAQNRDFLSDTEMDALMFDRQALAAQVKVAKAGVQQARASLSNSRANLEYTEIRSPVDGIVIDRKIDPGQTLAAQFQTPELFIVAPDLREKVHVFASVDEAEIGFIQQAQKANNRVLFTVDAHPDEVFEGEIEEIRYSSTTTQNVVTYPVVVAAKNHDFKLLPGMTAGITFEVEKRDEVLRIPNEALRFYPADLQHVRQEDHALLDGSQRRTSSQDSALAAGTPSAEEKAAAYRERNRRHVWVVDGEQLRAVEVVTGLAEHKHTELLEGDLKVGDLLVTGRETKKK